MAEETLINRFCRLDLNNLSDEQFKTDANTLLDQLLSHAHWMSGEKGSVDSLQEQSFGTFITYGCRILDGKNNLLKSKFANTVYLFLINRKKCLSQGALSVLLSFLLSSINDCPDSLKIYFLQALGAAFYGNGPNLDAQCLELVLGPSSHFLSLLDLANNSYGIQSEVVQCIGNLCLRSVDGSLIEKSLIKMLYQKVTDFLRGLLNLQDEDNLSLYKLVAKTLKVLQTLMSSVSLQDGIIEADFAIALLRVYLVYGLPGFRSTVVHLSKNLPSARAAPTYDMAVFTKKSKSPLIKPAVKKKRKGKKPGSKKHLNFDEKNRFSDSANRFSDDADRLSGEAVDNMFDISLDGSFASSQSSSESEFSDSETGCRNRLRITWSRIRQNALRCIQDVLRCFDRRGKLSSWLLLVPETTADLEPSLISTVMSDNSAKVRLLSLACLTELFNNSKQYLDAAVVKSQNQATTARAFEPFSVRLHQSLVSIHEAFLQCLEKRNIDITTDKLLQCISVLVLNTPYEKIGSELLYRLAEMVPYYLSLADLNVTITTLTCLAAIMSVKQDDERVLILMSDTPKTLRFLSENINKHKLGFSSWIARYCYQELNKSEQDTANSDRITNQCLQVFKIIVQCYPNLLSRQDKEGLLSLISQKYIKVAESITPFHAVKLIEEFGKHYAKMANGEEECMNEGLSFWNKILDGPLVHLFQYSSSVPKILSAACDVIATISPELLDALNIRHQIMCKTLLLGAASDDDNSIKSAAVRALGIFVTYPFVKEDSSFVIDVGQVIFNQLKSEFVSVRMKAGWALGNFTDSLIKNKPEINNEEATEFSNDFILDLLRASKQAAQDHDKVKPNGVRAVGNVLRWLPINMADQTVLKSIITESVSSLTQNILSGPMKGRWNACYASSSMFQSNSIHLGEAEWTEQILMALASSLKDCKNFKVRISAAVALSTPKLRQNYGNEDLFNKIWHFVIDALVSSEDLTDFTEFRFKGTLQNKIFLLFCHMLNLASSDDCSKIETKVIENSNLIQFHMGVFANSLCQSVNGESTVVESQESGPNLDDLAKMFSKFPKGFKSIKNSILDPVAELRTAESVVY